MGMGFPMGSRAFLAWDRSFNSDGKAPLCRITWPGRGVAPVLGLPMSAMVSWSREKPWKNIWKYGESIVKWQSWRLWVSLISNDERTSTCGNIPFFSEPFWEEHHKSIHLKIRNAYPERPNIPNSIAACVWLSSPVTMFPTARSAGVCTKGEVCSLSYQNLRIETSLPTVTTKKE